MNERLARDSMNGVVIPGPVRDPGFKSVNDVTHVTGWRVDIFCVVFALHVCTSRCTYGNI